MVGCSGCGGNFHGKVAETRDCAKTLRRANYIWTYKNAGSMAHLAGFQHRPYSSCSSVSSLTCSLLKTFHRCSAPGWVKEYSLSAPSGHAAWSLACR